MLTSFIRSGSTLETTKIVLDTTLIQKRACKKALINF